jgi:hypothetical protein
LNGTRRPLEKFSFTSAMVPGKNCNTSMPTIIRTLKRHLGLQKISRR